jgi:hypothetical protein
LGETTYQEDKDASFFVNSCSAKSSSNLSATETK